jgi:hypothetical protein
MIVDLLWFIEKSSLSLSLVVQIHARLSIFFSSFLCLGEFWLLRCTFMIRHKKIVERSLLPYLSLLEFSAVAVMMLLLTLLLIHILHHHRRKFIWARQRAQRKKMMKKGKFLEAKEIQLRLDVFFSYVLYFFFCLWSEESERENFLNLKSLRYWKSSLIRLDVLFLWGCCWR